MRRFWLSGLVVLVVAAAIAAAAAGARPPARTHHAHAVARIHAKVAVRQAVDPDETAGEQESVGDSAIDHVDAGGDHQCPPACAPGEAP